MLSLDTRIPPPIVALLFAIVMWGLAEVTSPVPIPATLRVALCSLLALGGLAFSVAGMLAFRSAKTTVNPLKPETASTLVTTGVYGITRNPMYVGLLFLLAAWAIYLSSAWALLGPVAFVLYITRFQILPEERALSGIFGGDYVEYLKRSRRWLWG